jgi:hypothetical protein
VVEIRPQASVVVRPGGDLSSCNSDVLIPAGATLRVEGGITNPGALRFQGGRGIVTAGTMNGRVVSMTPGSEVVASGSTARFACQDDMQLSGAVTISDGARLQGIAGMFFFSAAGCHVMVSDRGFANLVGVQTDAASVIDVRPGGVWHVAADCQYHGPLLAAATSDVLLRGHFYSTVDVAEGAAITRSDLTFDQGLTVELDGVAPPSAPIVPAPSFGPATTLSGPLTVRLRNGNALRVGDVYPIMAH